MSNDFFIQTAWTKTARRAMALIMTKRHVHPHPKPQRRRTYIREWRKFRNLTLEKLADRVGTTAGNLSMIERGINGYTQDMLEALADALGTEPASLLMRDPNEQGAIWSIWENASPGERRQIIEIAEALKRARG